MQGSGLTERERENEHGRRSTVLRTEFEIVSEGLVNKTYFGHKKNQKLTILHIHV